MIHLKNISLSFGEQIIFNNITGTIDQHQRVGLVGRNGSGKSTLLKVIAGMIQLDAGSVQVVGNKKIAYMPQEVVLASQKTVFDEALTAFAQLTSLQQEAHDLEERIATFSHTHSTSHSPAMHDTHAALLERYAHVSQELATHNPTQAAVDTERILTGLGFKPEQCKQLTSTLSVGWQMRLVLAKLLLTKADFYLFDEPTNHLDISAKDWFLSFLQENDCGFLLVCHERYFLDHICTHIFELELGKGTMFRGSFSAYEKHKELALQQLEAAYAQQQREIRHKEEIINRFRAKASKAAIVQSMIKALDKIERIVLPPSIKTITIKLPPPSRSGKMVLDAQNISYSFGEKTIFSHANVHIERGEKVALVAPNGVGKTTLFNVITGKLPLQQGTITVGAQVTPALFAQDQTKVLNDKKTVLENVQEQCPKIREDMIRSLLGSFLFGADEIQKPVNVLSGGEKNRVGMVCVLLQQANFLLLDEPTNNLDIPSKEILLNALLGFEGTLFFVSHDHDFINRLATRIIELSPQGTISYHGNYQDYLYQKQHRDTLAHTGNTPASQTAQKISASQKNHAQAVQQSTQPAADKKEVLEGKQLFELRKRVKKLETTIDALEREKATLEERFAHLTYGTPEFDTAQKQLQICTQKLEASLAEWEAAHELLS